MESLLIAPHIIRNQQKLHLLRRRPCRGGDVSDSCSSSSSRNEDEDEEVTSSNSSSSSTPLQDMSSLLIQLPLKRGLSKHYNGKSQSFTSLSSVKSLEDLAKQENLFNKKLKKCNTRKEPPTSMGSNFSSSITGGNSNFLGN